MSRARGSVLQRRDTQVGCVYAWLLEHRDWVTPHDVVRICGTTAPHTILSQLREALAAEGSAESLVSRRVRIGGKWVSIYGLGWGI